MNHQLILRFRKASLDRADAVQVLEAELASVLGDSARVDGLDTGRRELDLFIETSDPATSFRRCKPALEKMLLLERVVVAHRPEGGARFTVIWPRGYGRKFTLG